MGADFCLFIVLHIFPNVGIVVFLNNVIPFRISNITLQEQDIEGVLDDAYVKFLELKNPNPLEEDICKYIKCVHVSEITYGQPRRTEGLEPTMVIGVEAERGLCWTAERKFDPNEISWICPPAPTMKKVEVNGDEVAIIGNIDFLVYFPPKYFGVPFLAVGEKKTGHYRGSEYGEKKRKIALHQLIIYGWLFGTNLGVIQADYPREKGGKKYLVTHEVYILKWDSPEFEKRLKERIKCALVGKEKGWKSWWKCLEKHSLEKFATRIKNNSVLSYVNR